MASRRICQFSLATVSFCFFLLIVAGGRAPAQTSDSAQSTAWAAAAIAHARHMRIFHDPNNGTQQTPPTIPELEVDLDPNGLISTFQPDGATISAQNPFFQNLGTNGRTCFTCHQPQTGWTISADSVKDRFDRSQGSDPLFRLVDGATCPSDNVSTPAARRTAYSLLLAKGLIRIGIGLPTDGSLQFEIDAVKDPYGCNTNPITGLTSKTTGIVSIYRRPLPATNLGFLSTIMWDGREPSLAHQALDATLGHAQGNPPGPSTDQQIQIVDFESGIYTAQIFDNHARLLLAPPTTLTVTKPPIPCSDTKVAQTGGPFAIAALEPNFFLGLNDPLGLNPCNTAFTSNIFDLYAAWQTLQGQDDLTQHRLSIARGEVVFNTKPINIKNVAGLNDGMGNCGTCHDTPNIGNHSVKAPLNIGITDAVPPDLDVSGLPVFTITCTAGPLAGNVYHVTDPGRALISGNCADIGKTKGPILRGLAARSPYFHNGSAATLMDAANFYNDRFNINFTDQEKEDLVNFLETL
jgi:cytochrome c peroxidase